MTTAHAHQRLNVASFARDGAHLAGQTPLASMQRVAQEASEPVDGIAASWSTQGELRTPAGAEPQVWLHLQVQARLPMTCQRCMGRVEMVLAVDRSFRFVADEDTAMALDDGVEEDLLVLDRQFDLLGLVEDELLMALPVVPRHEVCPTTVTLQVADAEFDIAQSEKPNPFAVLQKLKAGKAN